MDIQLQVDKCSLQLGMPAREIERIGLLRPGFIMRCTLAIFMHRWGGNYDSWLWAKNPQLVVFDDFRTRSIGNDPNAKALDAIFGTSVFVVIRAGRACRIHAQVFQSVVNARGLAHEFRESAFARFGKCTCSKSTSIPRFSGDNKGGRDSYLTAWRDSEGWVVCELSLDGQSCSLHVGSGQLPEQIRRELTRTCDTLEEISDTEFFQSTNSSLVDLFRKFDSE